MKDHTSRADCARTFNVSIYLDILEHGVIVFVFHWFSDTVWGGPKKLSDRQNCTCLSVLRNVATVKRETVYFSGIGRNDGPVRIYVVYTVCIK